MLAGSLIEALLLWKLNERNPAVVFAALESCKRSCKVNSSVGAEMDRWHLHELLEVSAELRSIGADTANQVRSAKDFRNLIHPGREKRLAVKCGRGEALVAVGTVELVARDLAACV